MPQVEMLRRLPVLLALLLVITAVSPTVARAAGPEQITNGGFDNGLVG